MSELPHQTLSHTPEKGAPRGSWWLALLLAGGALLGATACQGTHGGGARAEDAAPSSPDSGPTFDFGAFDEAIQAELDKSSTMTLPYLGLSAVVVDAELGIVHQRGYGVRAVDHVYLIGSASTVLSAGVVMRLVDSGLLALDAPISQYLSAWGEHKPALSVAQLLSNSSGLPSIDELRNALNEPLLDPRYAPHVCQRSEAGTLAECGKSIYQDDAPENNRPPDTQFRIGGSGWQLLGALAEQVSGQSWRELIEQTYVVPCGMRSVGYTNQYRLAPTEYPALFAGDPQNLPDTENPSIEAGAYLSAPDFGKLLAMHQRAGLCGDVRVLSAESVARMQENRVGRVYAGRATSPGYEGYGLGWWVSENRRALAAPGAYGLYAVVDLARGYAFALGLELPVIIGSDIVWNAKPELDAIWEARR